MQYNALLNFITHYGIPKQITADSGNEFNGLILKEFCKLNNINLHITTIGNSNWIAPVERFHSTILDSIRC